MSWGRDRELHVAEPARLRRCAVCVPDTSGRLPRGTRGLMAKVVVICQTCGKSRVMYPSQAAVTKFCGTACALIARRKSDEIRFWSMCDRSNGSECWLWTGNVTHGGYGIFHLGKERRANRVAWMLSNHASIPPGLVVRHTCDRPACINPRHLLLGTHLDNQRDSISRGRRQYQRDMEAFAMKFTKLTKQEVIEIKRIAGRLRHKQREALALKYGVSVSVIKAIRLGTSFRWLEV